MYLYGADPGLEHVQDVLGHLVGYLLATPRQYLGLLKTLHPERERERDRVRLQRQAN